jgi:hypothetical protein
MVLDLEKILIFNQKIIYLNKIYDESNINNNQKPEEIKEKIK